MNPEHCLIERNGHVLVITLNRPEATNALSPGMLAGMYRAWRLLDGDPELRVAILTGRGAVFCAGADLKAPLMRMLREVDESYSEADALAKELEYGAPIFGTRDSREGRRAFAEKRKPVYTGE